MNAENFEKFCRVCFQSSAEMISAFTSLIVEDTSCTIIEILRLFLQEKVEDPEIYPKGICQSCKELVDATIHLKVKYEKTSQLLNDWFNSHTTGNKVFQIAKIKTEDVFESIEHFEEEEESEESKNTSHNKDETKSSEVLLKKRRINNRLVRTSSKKSEVYFNITQTEFNHICPFCMISLPNAVEVKKHALHHKTLRKHLKGRKVPEKSKFLATPRDSQTIFNKQEILHKCLHCKTELSIDDFLNHISKHNKQVEFPCNKCDRVFRKRNHLNSHITYTHLEEFPYQCHICGKGFVIKDNYDGHLLFHSNPKVLPYNCTKCEKSFANKKHLYYHSFKHTELGSFSAKYKTHRCKICLRTFENANGLQEHRIEVHKKTRNKIQIRINAEGLFKCGFCVKTYKNAIALKQHIRITHGQKNLCSLCGATVLNLKQHMTTHETKKDPLECHICHKLLASKLTLSRHIRVHTGEKPYKCGYCDKSFKDHYPMRVHERIHIGEKKHICNACGKGFLEKSYMMKHLRAVHSK